MAAYIIPVFIFWIIVWKGIRRGLTDIVVSAIALGGAGFKALFNNIGEGKRATVIEMSHDPITSVNSITSNIVGEERAR